MLLFFFIIIASHVLFVDCFASILSVFDDKAKPETYFKDPRLVRIKEEICSTDHTIIDENDIDLNERCLERVDHVYFHSFFDDLEYESRVDMEESERTLEMSIDQEQTKCEPGETKKSFRYEKRYAAKRRMRREKVTVKKEKKPRTNFPPKFDDNIRNVLEESFQTCHFLTPETRVRLVAESKLTEKQVKKWFMHRRERERKLFPDKEPLGEPCYPYSRPNWREKWRKSLRLHRSTGANADTKPAKNDQNPTA